jgi:hypothetical protein
MTTKNKPLINAQSSKTIAVLLLFCLSSVTTFCQEEKSSFGDSKYENEWWFPLIKKHQIDPTLFSSWGNIKPESNTTTGFTALELGKGAYVNDTSLIIKDPIFIIKENEEEYNLVFAKSASHNLRNSQIIWKNGKIETYKFNTKAVIPTLSYSFDELKMDTKTNKVLVKNATTTVLR